MRLVISVNFLPEKTYGISTHAPEPIIYRGDIPHPLTVNWYIFGFSCRFLVRLCHCCPNIYTRFVWLMLKVILYFLFTVSHPLMRHWLFSNHPKQAKPKILPVGAFVSNTTPICVPSREPTYPTWTKRKIIIFKSAGLKGYILVPRRG